MGEFIRQIWVNKNTAIYRSFITLLYFQLDCCGTSNDDMGYKDWTLNSYFNCSGGTNPQGIGEYCSVPFSCCIEREVKRPVDTLKPPRLALTRPYPSHSWVLTIANRLKRKTHPDGYYIEDAFLNFHLHVCSALFRSNNVNLDLLKCKPFCMLYSFLFYITVFIHLFSLIYRANYRTCYVVKICRVQMW